METKCIQRTPLFIMEYPVLITGGMFYQRKKWLRIYDVQEKMWMTTWQWKIIHYPITYLTRRCVKFHFPVDLHDKSQRWSLAIRLIVTKKSVVYARRIYMHSFKVLLIVLTVKILQKPTAIWLLHNNSNSNNNKVITTIYQNLSSVTKLFFYCKDFYHLKLYLFSHCLSTTVTL